MIICLNIFLFQCQVLPPKDLLHPLLPDRVGHGSTQKLIFHLCKTCAETRDVRDETACNHTDEQRAFWNAWTTIELYKAIELGYKVG
jgi:sulfur relay (sulfurtransferase) complex TusBCD TusD component (DsrE family)